MTAEEIELCATLAGIYFGTDFKDFVSIIGGNDFLTLFHIRQRITSYANKVQLAQHLDRVEHILKLLMKHRMVEARTGNGAAQYRLALRHIRIFMSFPRFKYHIEEIFGKLGSAIVEYLLENGHCQAYQIVEELAPFVPMYEELTIPVPNGCSAYRRRYPESAISSVPRESSTYVQLDGLELVYKERADLG